MAENTKTPPSQDRSRMPQGNANKPQKPGGPAPTGNVPGGRQGVNNPGKPGPEIDPDRARPDRNKSGVPEKIDVDDLDDDEAVTPSIDRG